MQWNGTAEKEGGWQRDLKLKAEKKWQRGWWATNTSWFHVIILPFSCFHLSDCLLQSYLIWIFKSHHTNVSQLQSKPEFHMHKIKPYSSKLQMCCFFPLLFFSCLPIKKSKNQTWPKKKTEISHKMSIRLFGYFLFGLRGREFVNDTDYTGSKPPKTKPHI